MSKKILVFIGIGIIIVVLGVGGYFFLIPRCPKSCDDGNFCTQDICSLETDYQCKHAPIVGSTDGCKDLVGTCQQYQCAESKCQIVTLADCCGNGKCEVKENWKICPHDCELCDDGNPCTQDIYSYEIGKCSYIKLTGPQPGCSAKIICGSWTCKTGICQIEYVSNCCGNKICETGETYETCSADCPNCDDANKCTADSYDYYKHTCVNTPILDVICCGNTLCETGETYQSCSRDCPNCDDANKCTKDSYDYHQQKCLNEILIPCCGNGICDEDIEEYSSCPIDCPKCDDNNKLTTDSFDYTTQKCKYVVIHYFIDDFEKGVYNWSFFGDQGPTETAWSAMAVAGNTVLRGTGHNWANLDRKEWTNYIFKTKFKIIKEGEGIHINFRNKIGEGNPTRYFIRIGSNNLNLAKQINEKFFDSLAQSNNFPVLGEGWHTFEIRGYGDILNIYIDNNLLIKYKDIESPIFSGGVAFETLNNSEYLIDDVEIKLINAGDIIYP